MADPVTAEKLDWSDFEPKNGREALGLALLTAGYFTDPDEAGNVKLDMALADDVLATLQQHGYFVFALEPARAYRDLVMAGASETDQLEAWAIFDDALTTALEARATDGH